MSKRRYLGWDEEKKIATNKRIYREAVPAAHAAPCFDAAASVFAELTRLRTERLFCDVTLRLDDGARLPAHRVVLAAGSEYFRAVFTCALHTDTDAVVECRLSGVSRATALRLLDFLYQRRLAPSRDTPHELLVLADFLGVLDLLALCCDALAAALAPDNCISTMRFARCYKDLRCRALAEKAYDYVVVHFGDVVDASDELLALHVEELALLLATDRLNLESEERAWECVMRWIEVDKVSRPRHLLRLLQAVRFSLLAPEFFMRHVRYHPWLTGSGGARRFVTHTMREVCGLADPEDARAVQPSRISTQTLFALGGWSGARPTDVVEVYDCRRDAWLPCAGAVDPLGPRAYQGVAALGTRLLLIGGFDGRQEYYSSCRCFDAVRCAWSDAAPMHYARCYVSVAVLANAVFAMGGYDGQFRQNTAERYDPAANQWRLLAPMNEQRSDASAAALDGKVFVAGGFDGIECISTCEMFDPATNQWTMLRPMTARRSGVSCVAHGGSIYALGGFNGECRLASCERYDPRDRAWHPVADMLFARSNFGCAVLDSRIHVFGGFNGSATCADTECLDAADDCWRPRAPMHLHRSALSTVALLALPNRDEYFGATDDSSRDRLLELMGDWRDAVQAPPPAAPPAEAALPAECWLSPKGVATGAGGRGLAGCSGDADSYAR